MRSRARRWVGFAACLGLLAGGWGALAAATGGESQGRVLVRRAARAALQAWRGFPVSAVPRPVVVLGGQLAQAPEDQHDAVIFDTGVYRFHARLPSGPAALDGYRLISALRASRLVSTLGQRSASARPRVVITSVRLGRARLSTDRRTLLPAWLFYAHGLRHPAAVLAVRPFSAPHPTRPRLPQWVHVDTAEESAVSADDGRRVAITFTGGPAGNQTCDDHYTVSAFTDRRAVAFAIRETPVAGDSHTICALVGYQRQVILRLARPLGQRVLLDAADAIAVPVRARP